MWLAEPRAAALSERRRHVAGPTGCGLCGIESLEEAVRALPRVADETTFTPDDIMRALETLIPRQELNRQTRAVHAAAFWRADAGLVALRDDVKAAYARRHGFELLRFNNTDVWSRPDWVLDQVRAYLLAPHPLPPPRKGEGE